jgi:hypothetical protein
MKFRDDAEKTAWVQFLASLLPTFDTEEAARKADKALEKLRERS